MNTHIAVYTNDPKIFEQLKQSAEVTNFILYLNPDISNYKTNHFIIVDLDYFKKNLNCFEDVERENLYLLSKDTDENNMILIDQYKLHHLIGLNENTFAQEIMCNLQKTWSGKIWGNIYYLSSDADTKIISLSDSKYTNELIQEALSHFDFKDYFSSPTEYIQVMANELISNSLYKGPNKKRAEQGLENLNRREPVFLKGSDLVQVTLGMDSRGVALSVQDSFGGLNYDILMASLKRSFLEKTAIDKKNGAGLGLYLTFLHSNQFIINYKKNFRTEVICIIEKNKRYKDYKKRIRSFHFFQEVQVEKTND